MAGGIMRNDPGFDPISGRKLGGGRGKGKRAIIFTLVVLLGGGFAFVAATKYLFSRGEQAEAKATKDDPRIVMPTMDMETARVEPVAESPPLEEAAPPVEEEQQKIARRPLGDRGPPGRRRGPQLPTQIAWDVQVSGAEPDMEWFADGRRPHLAHGCALRPGASIIPAVLNTVIQSEVPGQVIATVSQDVYDADGQGNLLVPQGTKLTGGYVNDLTLGSRRLGVRWLEMAYPNGAQRSLSDANGMDVAGSMGVGGEVTTAWGQVLMTVAVFSLFDAAQNTTTNDGSYAGNIGNSAADQASRTSNQIVKKMLDQAVKIRIPAGTQIIVSVGKTLQLC